VQYMRRGRKQLVAEKKKKREREKQTERLNHNSRDFSLKRVFGEGGQMN